MQTRQLHLDNGLHVTLVHQPDARQAAALWCVDAGSLQEPQAWPGLAHLLEHMLFRGSLGFPQAQRLISWVPSQGGRLNASTRLAQTAYFFEVPADLLEPGLLRLTDMLVTPQLNESEILAEASVIDAEYRLLQHDAEKRREAALLKMLDGDGQLARFRIGNHASFGDEAAPLQQALQAFHQQHYHAGNLRLFLQGPQTLENLEALARCSAAPPPSAREADALMPLTLERGDCALHQPRETMLVLSFTPPAAASGALRLLETLLLDETAGGLMDIWRQRNLVTAINLQADCLNAETLWLRFTFTLRDETVSPAQVESLFFRWLDAVSALSETQCQALCNFTQHAFMQLAPLEALRARAIGLLPPDPDGWPALLAALTPANASRLWASPEVRGETVESQGFTLTLAPFVPQAAHDEPVSFTPFPTPAPLHAPALPSASAPLAWQPAEGDASLRLRPQPTTALSDETGWWLASRLRPLSAWAARQGGVLTVQREQGIWQLHLCGEALLMQSLLAEINQILQREDANAGVQARLALAQETAREMQGSAVRRLLAQLPRELTTADIHPAQQAWQAHLAGGDAALHQALSRLLSTFIFPVETETDAPPLIAVGKHFTLDTQEEDNALLLFLPVEEEIEEMQALVQRYQPLFFHQMRVERSLGYVAQCQWYYCADRQGVLVVMQSPTHSPDALREEAQGFFVQQASATPGPQAEWLAQQMPNAWRGTSGKAATGVQRNSY